MEQSDVINFKGGGIGLRRAAINQPILLYFLNQEGRMQDNKRQGQIDLSLDAVVLAAGEKAGVNERSAWNYGLGSLGEQKQGLFAGVSINTSLVVVDKQATYDYYDRMYDGRYLQQLPERLKIYKNTKRSIK